MSLAARPSSFEKLDAWVKESAAHGAKDPVVLVIGNKIDKTREVSEGEGKSWAASRDMIYVEMSAKDGAGVQAGFESLFVKVCGTSSR